MIKERKPIKPGTKFGRLTVIKRGKDYVPENSTQRVTYLCFCDCGRQTEVVSTHLRSGNTQSCGCRKNLVRGENSITHNKTGTLEWRAWTRIKSRCKNSENKDYKDYGGRGITICKRWEDFSNFLQDMGKCPEGYSIDRINVNGNYEPENCRWADNYIQAQNKRIRKINTSGRTGVSWKAKNNKWQVTICVKGKQIYGGVYEDFDSAVKAREKLEIKYHGAIRSVEYETRDN